MGSKLNLASAPNSFVSSNTLLTDSRGILALRKSCIVLEDTAPVLSISCLARSAVSIALVRSVDSSSLVCALPFESTRTTAGVPGPVIC